MELISNAHQWHRLWSIRFAILSALFGALATAYAGLPADWLPAIPQWAKLAMAAGTLSSSVSAAVARVVQQSSLTTTITPSVPPPEGQ